MKARIKILKTLIFSLILLLAAGAASKKTTAFADSAKLSERYVRAEGIKIDATGVKAEVKITTDGEMPITTDEYLVLDMRVDSVEHASGDIYAFYQIILTDSAGNAHNLDSRERIENVTTAGFTVPNKPFEDTSWYLVKTGFNGKIYIELKKVLDENVTLKEITLVGDTSHKNHYLLRNVFFADALNATSGRSVTDFENLQFDEEGNLTNAAFSAKKYILTENLETVFDVTDGYAENGRLKSLVIKTEGFADITLSSSSPINARSAMLFNFNTLGEKGIKVKIVLKHGGVTYVPDYSKDREYSFATGNDEYGKVVADGEGIAIEKGKNGTLCLPYSIFGERPSLISEITISVNTYGEEAEIGNVTEFSAAVENKNTVYSFSEGSDRISVSYAGNENHRFYDYSDLYDVTVNVAGGGGTAEYRVENGTVIFVAKPSSGYSVKNFTVNGDEKKLEGNEFRAELKENFVFEISYKLSGIETEVNDENGATIYYVKRNGRVTFKILTNEGYTVERAELNGEAVATEDNSYEVKNPTADLRFKVFVRKLRVIADSVGNGKAEYEIKSGRIRFIFTAEEGYELKKVVVNGKSIGYPTETFYTDFDKDVTVTGEFGKKYEAAEEEKNEKSGCAGNLYSAETTAVFIITLAAVAAAIRAIKKKVNK